MLVQLIKSPLELTESLEMLKSQSCLRIFCLNHPLSPFQLPFSPCFRLISIFPAPPSIVQLAISKLTEVRSEGQLLEAQWICASSGGNSNRHNDAEKDRTCKMCHYFFLGGCFAHIISYLSSWGSLPCYVHCYKGSRVPASHPFIYFIDRHVFTSKKNFEHQELQGGKKYEQI